MLDTDAPILDVLTPREDFIGEDIINTDSPGQVESACNQMPRQSSGPRAQTHPKEDSLSKWQESELPVDTPDKDGTAIPHCKRISVRPEGMLPIPSDDGETSNPAPNIQHCSASIPSRKRFKPGTISTTGSSGERELKVPSSSLLIDRISRQTSFKVNVASSVKLTGERNEKMDVCSIKKPGEVGEGRRDPLERTRTEKGNYESSCVPPEAMNKRNKKPKRENAINKSKGIHQNKNSLTPDSRKSIRTLEKDTTAEAPKKPDEPLNKEEGNNVARARVSNAKAKTKSMNNKGKRKSKLRPQRRSSSSTRKPSGSQKYANRNTIIGAINEYFGDLSPEISAAERSLVYLARSLAVSPEHRPKGAKPFPQISLRDILSPNVLLKVLNKQELGDIIRSSSTCEVESQMAKTQGRKISNASYHKEGLNETDLTCSDSIVPAERDEFEKRAAEAALGRHSLRALKEELSFKPASQSRKTLVDLLPERQRDMESILKILCSISFLEDVDFMEDTFIEMGLYAPTEIEKSVARMEEDKPNPLMDKADPLALQEMTMRKLRQQARILGISVHGQNKHQLACRITDHLETIFSIPADAKNAPQYSFRSIAKKQGKIPVTRSSSRSDASTLRSTRTRLMRAEARSLRHQQGGAQTLPSISCEKPANSRRVSKARKRHCKRREIQKKGKGGSTYLQKEQLSPVRDELDVNSIASVEVNAAILKKPSTATPSAKATDAKEPETSRYNDLRTEKEIRDDKGREGNGRERVPDSSGSIQKSTNSSEHLYPANQETMKTLGCAEDESIQESIKKNHQMETVNQQSRNYIKFKINATVTEEREKKRMIVTRNSNLALEKGQETTGAISGGSAETCPQNPAQELMRSNGSLTMREKHASDSIPRIENIRKVVSTNSLVSANVRDTKTGERSVSRENLSIRKRTRKIMEDPSAHPFLRVSNTIVRSGKQTDPTSWRHSLSRSPAYFCDPRPGSACPESKGGSNNHSEANFLQRVSTRLTHGDNSPICINKEPSNTSVLTRSPQTHEEKILGVFLKIQTLRLMMLRSRDSKKS